MSAAVKHRRQPAQAPRVHLTRNTLDTHLVLTLEEGSASHLYWGPSGDPEGADVQIVGEDAASAAQFQRLVASGAVVVEGQDFEMDQAVAAHMTRQNELAAAARAKAAAAVEATVIRESDKDLLGETCIGPNSRGNGHCGDPVAVAANERGKVPPLCTRHKSLALQYVAVEVPDGDKSTTRWSHVTLGAREKTAS